MFDELVKNYTLPQLNQFQKTMSMIRKGANTKKKKIKALRNQIKFFNKIYATGHNLAGTKPKYIFDIAT